jgi:hypothetical protein
MAGAQGSTTVNFGAFPGTGHATVAITGQAGISGTALFEAWIMPVATADHSADEHIAETLRCIASDLIAGTGFTIHVFNNNLLIEPFKSFNLGERGTFQRLDIPSSRAQLSYGLFTVGWVWNN